MNCRSFVNIWYVRLLMLHTIFSYRSLNLLHWLCNRCEAKFDENSASRPLTCELHPVTAMTRHKIAGCERSQVSMCALSRSTREFSNFGRLEWSEALVTWFNNRFMMTSNQCRQDLQCQSPLFKKTQIFTYLIWTSTTQAGVEKQTNSPGDFKLCRTHNQHHWSEKYCRLKSIRLRVMQRFLE